MSAYPVLKSSSMILLITTSIVLQLFGVTLALNYRPAPLDYSSPKKTAQALTSRADDVSYALISYSYNFALNPNRGWHGSVGHRLEQTAQHYDKKAAQVGKLAKQLETNTVAGKAPSPRARTRSQTRKMAAPYNQKQYWQSFNGLQKLKPRKMVMIKTILLSGLIIKACWAAALKEQSQNTIHIPSADQSHPLLNDWFGYSIEPTAMGPYVESKIAFNILESIEKIIGQSAPIRVGGTTADEFRFAKSVNNTSDLQTLPASAESMNNPVQLITPEWYNTWKDYFPQSTYFIYTLNFANTTNNWEIAKNETDLVLEALKSKLHRFELGNEIDHYITEGWRKQGWDVARYVPQYRNLTADLEGRKSFKQANPMPLFQAGVIADPPLVPDQQDEVDDFSIYNLTTKGHLTNSNHSISSYAVHLYPQSNCDPEQAAQRAGAPLVFGETNSVSCSGKSGISDTFGATLWTYDYAMMSASLNIPQIFFHLGDQSEYSAFTPLPYEYKGEQLQAGIRANLYGHLFAAYTLQGLNGHGTVKALTDANSSDLSGYAIYDGNKSLKKVALLDMGVWNSTEGTANPSTLSSADSHSSSPGNRPSKQFNIQTSWKQNSIVNLLRLQAPGTNAKSLVNVSGQTFDTKTGTLGAAPKAEKIKVNRDGTVSVTLKQAEAVLLSV
ncbi:uncharacterized protein FA14DRAFT_190756 [Meira miltonrushii]|uniref:Beta-glucuronidase C-terminal domain-containing protein n=1 Tax=Meira miltonrushii TaxID=1280837 RepID=A0A316VCB3_9BASI|nr:uncharacterized protein FA14DRAFT_190756 [Meira miltonrushii]PWN33621.1 hypothetical protein FA14DRAFT_190756 [Meira miltonrushii]